MSRGGSKKEHVGSMRTCIGCRKVKPPELLVRLAVAPEGVVVDRRRRVPGRGAWVCQEPVCVKQSARASGEGVAFALRLGPAEILHRLVSGEAPVLGAQARQESS